MIFGRPPSDPKTSWFVFVRHHAIDVDPIVPSGCGETYAESGAPIPLVQIESMESAPISGTVIVVCLAPKE